MLHSLDDSAEELLALDNLDVLVSLWAVFKGVDLDDTTEASAFVHDVNELVHMLKSIKLVSDVVSNGELAEQDLVHELWHVLA